MDAIIGCGFLFVVAIIAFALDLAGGPDWDPDWLRGRRRGRTSDKMKERGNDDA